MMAHLWWQLDFLSPHQLKKGTLIKFGASIIKLSGSAHGLAYIGLSNTILFALTSQLLVISRLFLHYNIHCYSNER